MNLHELKSQVPETPESFSEMVKKEVERQGGTNIIQLADQQQAKSKRKKAASPRRMAWRIAAIVLAAIILIPSAVYAGIHFFPKASTTPEGEYGAKVGLEAETSKDTSDAEPTEDLYQLPDPVPDVHGELSFIPEGMEWFDGAHLGDPDNPDHRQIRVGKIAYDKGELEDTFLIRNVVDQKVVEVGDREGVYIQLADSYRGNYWRQRLYVLYPEYYHVLELIFTDEVTLDEAIETAKGITWSFTGETRTRASVWAWSDMIAGQINRGPEVIPVLEASRIGTTSNINLFAVGETASTKDSVHYQPYEICVEDVEVYDDIAVLDEDYFKDDDIYQCVDEDGNLLPAEISFILYGDGINTIHTVVGTKVQNEKLVYATLTFTNTGDETIDHLLFCGYLYPIEEKDGEYFRYLQPCPDGSSYNFISRSNGQITDMAQYTMDYFDTTYDGYGDGGNEISYLEPGESATVHIGWIVDEEVLPYLFLSMDQTGRISFDRGPAILFDLRQ
ncbi:MAG: hypothetical protein IKG51_06940 [Firmicutes bacterium]|nr:hypothetical protein [Bacillota bacterium]